jgi:hypothetical protein
MHLPFHDFIVKPLCGIARNKQERWTFLAGMLTQKKGFLHKKNKTSAFSDKCYVAVRKNTCPKPTNPYFQRCCAQMNIGKKVKIV